jgi:glutaredoxin
MKSVIICVVYGLIAWFIPLTSTAVTVVECVDAQGNSSFRDTCPPGMSVKSTKQLRGERKEVIPSAAEVANEYPVVFFSAPNCEACDLVRTHLQGRNVPFSEKDASEDPATQAELAVITGGPLTVPAVTVGIQKLTGYNQLELDSALNEVGYP